MHKSEGIGGAEVESARAREREKAGSDVSYEGVVAGLGKGMGVDPAEKLAAGVLVTDTGAYADCLKPFEDKKEFGPGDLDGLYRATIRDGVIDHHSVDMFLAGKGVRNEKCATQMVADYPDVVLEVIEDKGIEKVETHYDSDLDAVASAYLTKSLIDRGELPKSAPELARITNKVDYGRMTELGERFLRAETFVKTLPGAFDALKAEYGKLASARIAAEGFSPKILEETEAARNAAFFELLNAAEKVGADISGDLSGLDAALSEELRAKLESGREAVKEEFEQMSRDFEAAEQARVKGRDYAGKETEIGLVLGSSESPLGLTNHAYLRTSPDTVVAVFGGAKRKSGDNYDIGIQPDQAKKIDLRGLCLALNRAEQAKRREILAKDDSARSDDEKRLIETWASQKPREAFGGLGGMVERGEFGADEIPDKDPTVLVAGGSLIAASRTSLLSEDEFRSAVREHFGRAERS